MKITKARTTVKGKNPARSVDRRKEKVLKKTVKKNPKKVTKAVKGVKGSKNVVKGKKVKKTTKVKKDKAVQTVEDPSNIAQHPMDAEKRWEQALINFEP